VHPANAQPTELLNATGRSVVAPPPEHRRRAEGYLQRRGEVAARQRGAAARRDIKGMRNLQEGRHALAAKAFHGKKGELYQRYHEGTEDQLGALGLILNCIVLWNTRYMNAALDTPCVLTVAPGCRSIGDIATVWPGP
jgi:hypothetical protein